MILFALIQSKILRTGKYKPGVHTMTGSLASVSSSFRVITVHFCQAYKSSFEYQRIQSCIRLFLFNFSCCFRSSGNSLSQDVSTSCIPRSPGQSSELGEPCEPHAQVQAADTPPPPPSHNSVHRKKTRQAGGQTGLCGVSTRSLNQ